ncbi:hypothetical protein BDY21DRAFT_359194 [Lineolata rhizophorae]|uniref:Uncharacterized protein n=1 Tax=Lineolata rhizophorae TaxID=578093 RepID=A0A6A6NLB7_9PEZI|nr:hypothetical protein BDY21DRAFT_359194 [Lineolata rhizophorae]
MEEGQPAVAGEGETKEGKEGGDEVGTTGEGMVEQMDVDMPEVAEKPEEQAAAETVPEESAANESKGEGHEQAAPVQEERTQEDGPEAEGVTTEHGDQGREKTEDVEMAEDRGGDAQPAAEPPAEEPKPEVPVEAEGTNVEAKTETVAQKEGGEGEEAQATASDGVAPEVAVEEVEAKGEGAEQGKGVEDEVDVVGPGSEKGVEAGGGEGTGDAAGGNADTAPAPVLAEEGAAEKGDEKEESA